ncbi:MAG: His-Xaa-Ser system protein HxsD [Deltaproteobacteria bacterium]|nr:His-Xaa-Ser system protein HxsD [Deltaproteobacteria bacterium]
MSHVHIETLDQSSATLTLSLDVSLYPRDVLYAAAYVFLDRAYVLLDRQDARFVVRFRSKRPLDEAGFRAFAGEFENELLAQALRHRVVDANQRIIEDVVAVAIAGAAAGVDPGPGSTAAHPPFIDPKDPDDGFLDDPLEIARPFEPGKQGTE